MRRILALSVCCLVVTVALAQKQPATKGKLLGAKGQSATELSTDFKRVGLQAFDAINLVPDLRSSDTEFQPRDLEADKALTVARRSQVTSADKEAYRLLDAWLFLKVLSREADNAGDMDALKKALHPTVQCFTEAALIFDPTSFSDGGGKARATGKHCLEMKDQVQAERAGK